MKGRNEKDIWQGEAIDAYIKNGGRGTVVSATGTGKTMVGIKLIKGMNIKRPEMKTDVVVPRKHLKESWEKEERVTAKGKKIPAGHIIRHGLNNVNTFVMNTYSTLIREVDFLIIDEAHHMGAPTFKKIFENVKYKYLLLLTATPFRQDGEHFEILRRAPVVYKLSKDEAVRRGIISESVNVNLGIDLDEEELDYLDELNEEISELYGTFQHNWYLLQACARPGYKKAHVYFTGPRTVNHLCDAKQYGRVVHWNTADGWRNWYAQEMGGFSGDSPYRPKALQQQANIFIRDVATRQSILYEHPLKVEITVEICELLGDSKIIVFSQRKAFAEAVSERVPDSMVYHSDVCGVILQDNEVVGEGRKNRDNKTEYVDLTFHKPREYKWFKENFPGCKKIGADKNKRRILDLFEADEISVISAVTSLDEGLDVENADVAIVSSGTSVERQDTQRSGRVLRVSENKVATIINLYFKNTQDEEWLKSRQKSVASIIHVDSPREIITKLTLFNENE